MFKALVLEQQDGETRAQTRQLELADLPDGEVLVDVVLSSLNYKDGLAVTGTGKIVRDFPMVPGIDFAGTVAESASGSFRPGDSVILTGWGVGERYWGGYAQKARARPEWLVPMPEGLDARKAMTIGTAGLTAMLCVMALEDQGVVPDQGTVLVTGASGGVGGIAVTLLAGLGFSVAAVTGNRADDDYLYQLGATDIVSRAELETPCRPLEKQRWSGAVDTVGGKVLARLLAEMQYGGTIAATGLTGGAELNTTVMPFILRAVKMVGVEVTTCPIALRKTAWKRLAKELPDSLLQRVYKIIPLDEVPQFSEKLLAGQVNGRLVVDLKL